MDLRIGFGEIAEYTRQKLGQEVKLSFVDEKSANVSSVAKVTIPLINKEVAKEFSIKLSDIQMVGEDLRLHFDAGTMMNFLASFVVKLLPKSVIERGVVDFPDNSMVVVHLDKVEAVHDALRYIEVQAIRFEETAALIDFSMRLS